MKTSWKRGLDEQQAKDIEQLFKESGVIRRRLEVILRDHIEDRRIGATSEQLYDNPNWAYYQADRHGYERALRYVISLVNDKD